MMRYFKRNIIISIAYVFLFLLFCRKEVYAMTEYAEVESNDTAAEAQLVVNNAQTMAQAVSGSTALYRYVSGDIDADDVDWYKVGLTVHENEKLYIDMNVQTGTIYGELYMESNLTEPLQEFAFSSIGTKTYQLNISTTGTYYLRLYYTFPAGMSAYTYTIGNPKYTLGSYTYSFGSKTFQPYEDWNDEIPYSTLSDIPTDAIAYKVKVEGGTASFSTKRYFKRPNDSAWRAVNAYTFVYEIGVLEENRLNDDWSVRIVSESAKTKTVTPQFLVYYVAPDLSRM